MRTTRFEGQIVLVTGGGGGVGRATAREFAREGASVVIVEVNETAGRQAVAELRAISPETSLLLGDISSAEDVARMFGEVRARYGRLDVAVNNAAAFPAAKASIRDMEIEDFDRLMRVNLRGTFLCMQQQLRIMCAQRSGAIVNITSMAAHGGYPSLGGYATSKHALLGLTRTAAFEVARDNVRVTSLSPGPINTPAMVASESEEARAKQADPIPAGRIAEPYDIARGVLFLASPDAALCVGHTLHMDGGLTAVPRDWW